MKKILYSLAAIALVAAVSCSREAMDVPSYLEGGSPATVTFSLTQAGGINTKAIADGTTANKVQVGVYEVGDEAITLATTKDAVLSAKTGTVSLTLVKGKTYKLAFWAGVTSGSPYTVNFGQNEATVTASAAPTANSEANDAFYALVEYTVPDNDTDSQAITLTRPLAQVAILTPTEVLGYGTLTTSGITVKNAYTKMNLLTGEVSEKADVTFANAAASFDNETAPKDGYSYVAVGYVLAAANGGVNDIDFNANENTEYTYNVSNAPLKRNYRTLLLGNIFPAPGNTSETTWDVTLDPTFGGGSEANVGGEVPTVGYTGVTLPAEYDPEATDNASLDINATDDEPTVTFTVQSNSPAPINVESSNTAVATVAIEEGEVTITPVGNGETVITVSQDAYTPAANPAPGHVTKGDGDDTSYSAYSYSFLVKVTGVEGGDEPVDDNGDGTLENPYTVAGVRAYLDSEEYDATANVYVKGKISNVVKEFVSGGDGTFYISADGTESSEQFEAYRVLFLQNQNWYTGNTQIQVGDDVVLCGQVTIYGGSTYETANGKAYIYSLNGFTEEDVTPPSVDDDEKGGKNNPYTVAEALAVIDEMNSGDIGEVEVYVKGIVTSVSEVSAQYGNATYLIGDTADATSTITVFRGKYLENASFTSSDQIPVGAEVVVFGKLQKYVKNDVVTPEIYTGSILISIEIDTTTPVFGATINNESAVVAAGGTKTITVTGNVAWTASVTGEATLDYTSGEGAGTITVTIPENTSETVAPEFVVTVSTTADVETTSYEFTINQNMYVAPSEGENVVYTLTPASGTNNGYASNCDIDINGITWNLTGNSTLQPWRIGGKSLTEVDRSLYSKTALNYNISKIEITHGTASGITVNSMTVIVATDADFTDVVSTLTPTFAAENTVTVERPDGKDWSACYYKIVYNVTVEGSSNKFLQFTEAVFTGN